jgi:hypothetical protein
MGLARERLAAVYDSDFEALVGWVPTRCTPTGASRTDLDLYLVVRDGPRRGEVVWYRASGAERYDDVGEFHLAMLDYMRLEVQRMRSS